MTESTPIPTAGTEQLVYDVVVIGAGPGGSYAAKYAAAGGAEVLLLEKRQEIGSPVRCGEGISKLWLDRVGIEPDMSWIAHEVDGAKIVSPGGVELVIDEKMAGNEIGFVVERDKFDKALAADAARAGADVWVKASATGLITDDEGAIIGVRVERDGRQYEIGAKLVIGADGFESKVGRWAGIDTTLIPNHVVSCMQYRMVDIDIDSRYSHFYIGGGIAKGCYVWMFPKGESEANVGVGLVLSNLSSAGDVKRYLDEWIDARPAYQNGRVIERVSGGLSASPPLETTVTDHFMLVGDAARLTDPITGGGVVNALVSGKAAGETAVAALEAGDYSAAFLNRYDRAWRDELENHLFRNFLGREKLLEISEDTLDILIATIAEAGLEQLTVLNLLKVIQEKHPELVEELEGLL